VSGELRVTPAPLTITAVAASKVYGSANPAFTAKFEGFVLGQDKTALAGSLIFSTTATAASHVGNYPVAPSGAASADYAISYVGGELSVTPAPLLIIADDQIQPDGAPLPGLTASYVGFVNGDTAANLSTPVTLSTTAQANSLAGLYPITASGATSADYTITYRAGTLNVQTIKVRGKKVKVIVLNFSGALNASSAQTISNYRLVTAGRDKKFGTKDDKRVVLKSASYNASTHAVTITPKAALPTTQSLQFRAIGSSLKAASGRLIDGDHNGQAGGDAVSTIVKGKVHASRVTVASKKN
jgi:hypothetical protein